MQKDIIQELTVLQQTKCVDINLTNANVTIDSTYVVQPLGVIDDFYKDRVVTLNRLIPAGTYDILSNTSSSAIIDYNEIVFTLIPLEPIVPVTPVDPLNPSNEPLVPDVTFSSTFICDINFNDIQVIDDILVSDRKIILPSDIVTTQTYIIESNTNTSITLKVLNELDFNIQVTEAILERSIEFEEMINSFKAFMNTANDRTLTRFECPTNNSFFAKYDIFTDIMISYKNTYKIEDKMNDIIGVLNDFLRIDFLVYSTKMELGPYYTNAQEKIALIYETIDSWIAYFERLKKLMSKMRIADAKVDNENCQNMYDAKPLESQQVIDTMYNTFVDSGRDGYTDYKQELMFEIKID